MTSDQDPLQSLKGALTSIELDSKDLQNTALKAINMYASLKQLVYEYFELLEWYCEVQNVQIYFKKRGICDSDPYVRENNILAAVAKHEYEAAYIKLIEHVKYPLH